MKSARRSALYEGVLCSKLVQLASCAERTPRGDSIGVVEARKGLERCLFLHIYCEKEVSPKKVGCFSLALTLAYVKRMSTFKYIVAKIFNA